MTDKQGQKENYSFLQTTRLFLNSYLFYIIQTLAACLFVAFRMYIAGVIAFAVLLCIILLVCEDIFATTLPFLLLSCIATNCYNSYGIFMPYIAYAAIPAACIVAHFVVYWKPITIGESFYGIGMVSIALLLGGVGYFGFMEYIYGAYYILGLGIGMMICYGLMKSQFAASRNYDAKERFAVIMTLMGTLCVGMVAVGYLRKWIGIEYQVQHELPFSRNNVSTLLMFAMPFPLYFTDKKKSLGTLSVVFYGTICFTTSRGGMLFGALEFLICALFWFFQDKTKLWYRLQVCLIIISGLLFCCGRFAYEVLQERLLTNNQIAKDTRYTMMWQAWDNFLENPFVGTGLLEKDLKYAETRKAGALTWYHMMIPQVVGSMGIVGVLCYGYQILGRIRLVFKQKNAWTMILGISYLGILLMSQVNPGEFCPLPFELLTVLLFILIEEETKESLPLLKR